MTYFAMSLLVAAALQTPECALTLRKTPQSAFTNADLERMAACRYQTGVQSEATATPGSSARPGRREAHGGSESSRDGSALERDWRARWRSVDQHARRLRREARELRLEAAAAGAIARKDPGKRGTTGRRSNDILLDRAAHLESEAKRMEDEFQEEARREGALPGWLRPRGR